MHKVISIPGPPLIHPEALTTVEVESLTGRVWFHDRVMRLLLHRSWEPSDDLREIKEVIQSTGLQVHEICVPHLPWLHSQSSRERELLDHNLRLIEAYVNGGLYQIDNGPLPPEYDSFWKAKSVLPRNPMYRSYRKRKKKELARAERKILQKKDTTKQKMSEQKESRGAGNRPSNIF